jgi:hypothetical protein
MAKENGEDRGREDAGCEVWRQIGVYVRAWDENKKGQAGEVWDMNDEYAPANQVRPFIEVSRIKKKGLAE